MLQHNHFRCIVTPGCMGYSAQFRLLWSTQLKIVHFTTKMARPPRRHRTDRGPAVQEEWQMARTWLSSLGVLPDFHRASYPNASVFDLAQCLRDGVVLCQVANRLRPHSVPDINMRPQMSPVCSFAFLPIAFP